MSEIKIKSSTLKSTEENTALIDNGTKRQRKNVNKLSDVSNNKTEDEEKTKKLIAVVKVNPGEIEMSERKIESSMSENSEEKTVLIDDGIKRQRKSVNRLSDVVNKKIIEDQEKAKKVITGDGVCLGDIERFQSVLQRKKLDGEILKSLHNLCFRSIGVANKRNINLRKFKGFEDSQIPKRIALAEKIRLTDLKLLCDVFNIEVGSKTKNDIAKELVRYLQKPEPIDSLKYRLLRLKIKKKKTSKKTKKDTNKSKTKKSKRTSESFSEEIEDIPDEDDDDDEEEDVDMEEDNENIKTEDFETFVLSDSFKTMPKDQLKEEIQEILKSADLNEITIKRVFEEICDKHVKTFPGLVNDKPNIKELIKEVLATMNQNSEK